SAVIMGLACYLVYSLLFKLSSSNVLAALVAIVVAVVVYGVLLLVFKCVDEVELYQVPCGHQLVRVAKKLHLL
ncbi:MAG: polysaccharide biosynthesis protein, partial [Lachnospiraceae bacterium]|nr:polysaccharide biosynthesis protein [Lachnospiraceae bacterium]